MKSYSRIYQADDYLLWLHRFPLTRFNQVRQRTKSIQLFAGKLIRFIYAVIEKDEDHPPRLMFAEFNLCRFDESGYLDQKDTNKQLFGAVKMLELREGFLNGRSFTNWSTFSRIVGSPRSLLWRSLKSLL